MKKTMTILMGMITVLTLTLGVQISVEKQHNTEFTRFADGDHH
ncbi:Phr family secreted Rap phosphatase inhibitor [Bacillus toyonensis]|nr:Phr family secreted Rap phosphatase inhibitor [Bacillus toyonensis]MBF7149967.1 Phr family secreted Rap phosphatase inhibitor [Bacillus toyonensis]MEC2351587.1 Phr family secreted Rap phosphatase inhibitor [Bacillus toyonensis]MED3189457.1 Phr family secreted Rap phosphatase inhibitor [Bacillus toyonensis]